MLERDASLSCAVSPRKQTACIGTMLRSDSGSSELPSATPPSEADLCMSLPAAPTLSELAVLWPSPSIFTGLPHGNPFESAFASYESMGLLCESGSMSHFGSLKEYTAFGSAQTSFLPTHGDFALLPSLGRGEYDTDSQYTGEAVLPPFDDVNSVYLLASFGNSPHHDGSNIIQNQPPAFLGGEKAVTVEKARSASDLTDFGTENAVHGPQTELDPPSEPPPRTKQPDTSSTQRQIPHLPCRSKSCTKRFLDKRDLNRHINAVHKELVKQEKRFKCTAPDCPWGRKGFLRKDKLRQHWQRKHGDPSELKLPDGRSTAERHAAPRNTAVDDMSGRDLGDQLDGHKQEVRRRSPGALARSFTI